MPEPQNFRVQVLSNPIRIYSKSPSSWTSENSLADNRNPTVLAVCAQQGRAAARAWAQPGSRTEGSSAAGQGSPTPTPTCNPGKAGNKPLTIHGLSGKAHLKSL